MADGESRMLWNIMSMWWSTLLTLALSFISISISARALTEDEFGVYFLLLTLVFLLQVLSSLGIRPAAAQFIASTPDQETQQRIVSSVLTFAGLGLVLVSVLAVVARRLLLGLFPSDLLASLFVYVPVLYCIQTADLLLDSIMQGFQLYRKMALVRVVSSAINFGLVILFLAVFGWGLKGLLVVTGIAQGAGALLRLRMLPVKLAPRFDGALLRKLVRFGLPLQGNDVLTFISQRLDVIILGAMVSPASVAYLGVAAKIPQNFQRLFESLYAVYYPHMAWLFGQGQQARAEAIQARFLRLTAFVTMGCALVMVLFQREIITLVFSEKYLPSAPAMALLMVIFTLSVASTILDNTLIAAGHPDYLPLISLADTVPSVVSNLLLIPPFGFMGAVWAKLIANISTNPVSVWCLRREKIGVHMRDYLKPFGLMLVCMGLYFASGSESWMLRGALVALFAGLCVAFSVITSGDVVSMRGTLRLPSRRPVFDK
jgi:O-antigen/teichoic acid export membrane protein